MRDEPKGTKARPKRPQTKRPARKERKARVEVIEEYIFPTTPQGQCGWSVARFVKEGDNYRIEFPFSCDPRDDSEWSVVGGAGDMRLCEFKSKRKAVQGWEAFQRSVGHPDDFNNWISLSNKNWPKLP